MSVMNPHLPLPGEVAGESDREIRNIRILLCAAAMMGVIAIAVPGVFSHLRSAIYFLPQMMIGLAVLVLVIYLHFALQRKLLRELSTAWATASAYTERLEQFSFIDPQTELFNRRYLDHLFERQLKWVNRTGKQSSLLLFHVTSDGQKMSMDEVVLETAYILRSNFRGSDYIVRSGANQFVVLLPETADIQARFALNRLSDKVDSWNLESKNSGLVLQHELSTCSPGGSFWEGLRQGEERLQSSRASASSSGKMVPTLVK
jgi:diguanylate cyclase (GGDEF)-like protein